MEQFPIDAMDGDEFHLDIDTKFRIDCLAPEGTGLGVGTISRKTRLESGEITETDLARVREAIRDPSFYVPVEFGDDGCGDGRGTVSIYRVVKRDQQSGDVKEVFERSGHRSKVFGGGLNIGWAMNRAIKGMPKPGETLNEDRRKTAATLRSRGLEFGGHTGTHAHGENCGCGALDQTVAIVGFASEYKTQLHDLIKALKGDYFDEKTFDHVMSVFTAIVDDPSYTKGANGKSALDLLNEYGAVIKELGGEHNELVYIRNHIPGTTFDQARLNAETDDRLQAFVDDVWRREVYADELGMGKEWETSVADMAGEIITLATTIALTDGTQEVYQRAAA